MTRSVSAVEHLIQTEKEQNATEYHLNVCAAHSLYECQLYDDGRRLSRFNNRLNVCRKCLLDNAYKNGFIVEFT